MDERLRFIARLIEGEKMAVPPCIRGFSFPDFQLTGPLRQPSPAQASNHQPDFRQFKALHTADNFGTDWIDHCYPVAKGGSAS